MALYDKQSFFISLGSIGIFALGLAAYIITLRISLRATNIDEIVECDKFGNMEFKGIEGKVFGILHVMLILI